MKFERIKSEILEDAGKALANGVFFITHGFLMSWAAEHRRESDEGLKRYSTETRWNQYQTGKISREKAVNFAAKRLEKSLGKDTDGKLSLLERVENAPDLAFASIFVDWVRSSTWGHNPHAEVRTNAGTYTGTASGCGYDKESAAIANALNQCDSVLKLLFTLKENSLCAGMSDASDTCTGRNNRDVCGYGAGYWAIPKFEGGVGTSCFLEIFKKCGFKVTESHGKTWDSYIIERAQS